MVRRETRARRRGEGRKIAFVSMVVLMSFFVFVSVSFWFTDETENLETVKEREDFRGFVEETRRVRAKMREREGRTSGTPLRRRTLKDYAAILFTQNLCFDYFVASGGPYFCLYPVVCFGSDFFSCMTNAGVVQEINGISAQTAYGIGNTVMNSF